MAKHEPSTPTDKVINARSPWTATRRNWAFPSNPYKMSEPAWQALLARAKQGDPEAEWEISGRYEDGCKNLRGEIIVRRSPRKYAQWLRRAAAHGAAAAQNNLGILLGNGDQVRKNVPEALYWLKRAFRAGDCCAAQNIAITYRQIGDLKSAFNWFRKSAKSSDGDALIQLGIHYYWGKGTRKNAKAAVACFRRAAKVKNICESGRDDGFFWLGVAYLQGRGVKPSIANARRAFDRANIDHDHPAARKMLRLLHASQRRIPS